MSSELIKDGQGLKNDVLSLLIVEDDSIQSFVLKAMVKSMNFTLLGVATTGEEAIKMSTELKPDIILMDITLEGEMDGIDAAKKIQDVLNVKLIYITGNSGAYHINKAARTTYLDYLKKPINKQLLKKALDKCF